MTIRTPSTIALAWLALATLATPALADGTPGVRGARQGAAPMTTAARKPNDSGVKLQYRVDGTPQAGKPTAVVLQFDGVTHPDGATVRLSPDAGLTLSGSDTFTLPAGTRSSVTVTVVSDREGLAYLNVFIAQGGARSAISIPVQTGAVAPAAKPASEIKSAPASENIISLPAK
ncbi:hypothetical protein [Variovorax sp. E3]|uniref:hypothetical protein n=1 Tax=Variovorax sp. E3 TaxID=1914993 RepID=UPI0018DD09C4|nr:hypothetical protein [Variovorax sp. E3]